MAEHENEIKRNPESEKGEKPAKKEGPVRGEKKAGGAKRKETVYEAGGAAQADKGSVSRESLLRAALARAEPTKPEARRVDANLKKLLEFLKKKERGEKVNEEEKASLLELLLLLLKYLWKQLKEVLQDEEGEFAELIKAARSAGKESPQEMLKWMLGAFEFSPDEEKKLEQAMHESEVDERVRKLEEAGKTPEEIAARRRALMEGFVGGVGPLDVEGMGLTAMVTDAAAVMRDVTLDLDRVTRILEDPRAREFHEVLGKFQELPEIQQISSLVAEIDKLDPAQVDEAQDRYRKILELYEKIEGQRPRLGGRFLELYGERATSLYERVSKHQDAGVLALLTASREQLLEARDPVREGERIVQFSIQNLEYRADILPGISSILATRLAVLKDEISEADAIEDDEEWEQSINDLIFNFRESIRQEIVKPLIEDIIGDAEEDPREGFRIPVWGEIIYEEMREMIEKAGPLGPDEKRRWGSLFNTRRVTHFINMEVIKGGNVEEMFKLSERFLLGEDLDNITKMEPALSPARRLVEQILGLVREEPMLGGRIPYQYMIPDPEREYKIPLVEEMVAQRLLKMVDKDGRKIVTDEKEAERIAAMAVKITNSIEMRTAEQFSMTPLAPFARGEYLKSYPVDKMRFDYNRLTGERFQIWARGREAGKPWVDRTNQFVQPGVMEAIPGDEFDELGINPENPWKIGGLGSGSFWRMENAARKQIERGLTQGVMIASKTEFLDPNDPETPGKIAELEQMWLNQGRRRPTVVARFFPTVVLKSPGDRAESFDFQRRLRDEIIPDKKSRKRFLDYVESRAGRKFDEEGIEKHVKDEVKKDLDSLPRRYSLERETEKALAQSKAEINLQVGAQSTLLWMVAEELGEEFPVDPDLLSLATKERNEEAYLGAWKEVEKWERQVWGKWQALHEKLSVYEEYAMQQYIKSKGYAGEHMEPNKREDHYPVVYELVYRDELGLEFSEEERRIVSRLTGFGRAIRRQEDGEELATYRRHIDEEGRKSGGARRLAEVRNFSYTPFTEDIYHEDVEMRGLGPRVLSRRQNDILMAQKADQITWRIRAGLAAQEDKVLGSRGELVKELVELFGAPGYLNEPDIQKRVAAEAYLAINKMFNADWWASWMPFGGIIDWGGPFGLWKRAALSSRAQRKFGGRALSMTVLERFQFVEDLRPWIGNKYAKELQKKLGATAWHALASVFATWGPVYVVYILGKWGTEAIKQAGREIEGVATGR